ncbi:MAG: RnfABCDGE type electron transport complex subunit B [Christensenellales bacterium]
MNYQAILFAVAVLGGFGVIFGVVLSFADKVFAVPVDTRVALVREAVAGANCGACGYPGCDAFSAAVVKGEAKTDGCTPGGAKSASALAAIMGVEGVVGDPVVARIRCQGGDGIAKDKAVYEGYESCRHAMTLAGGPKLCPSACVGLKDCFKVCKFDAISFVNNLCVIDPAKCTACGMCVKECPNSLIKLLPRAATVTVRCMNTLAPKPANDSCKHACIGCKKCEKACEYDAIHVNNYLALIDTDKCTKCQACIAVCPNQCITLSD